MDAIRPDKLDLEIIKSMYTQDKKYKKCMSKEDAIDTDMIYRIIIPRIDT